MINAKIVWDRVNLLTKNGTSGYFNDADFKSYAMSAELRLMGMLIPLYEKNQQVADALSPFIKTVAKTSNAQGVINKDADYYGLASILLVKAGVEYPTSKIAPHEVGNTKTSPIRKPDYSKNEALYYQSNNKIIMLPEQVMDVNLIYVKTPVFGFVTTSTVSTVNEDYVTVTSQVDFEWNMDVFNILCFMILEQMGLSQKEQLSMQFAQMGIVSNFLNTAPQ
jgi:hypothetical protein